VFLGLIRARAADHAHAGEELDLAAGGARQLSIAPRRVAGLAEHLVAAHRHLVGADDDRPGAARQHGARLGPREPHHGLGGLLAGFDPLVDVGGLLLERQAEARQQGAPVRRARGEEQRRGRPRARCRRIRVHAAPTV
jgi:hypothetical protein